MNKITYGIVKEVHMCGETNRISYGIAAYADFESDESTTILASVSDISSDEEKVVSLVELCNKLQLSIYHLNDIVEDFIACS